MALKRELESVDDATLTREYASAESVSDLLRRIDITPNRMSWTHLRDRLTQLGHSYLELAHKGRGSSARRKHNQTIPDSDVFVNGRWWKGTDLKRRLLRSGVANECAICSAPPTWMGRSLSLVLDHINGINVDNRRGNLRLLCPNCHSQTDTFAGRNRTKVVKRICCDCSARISQKSIRCHACANSNQANIQTRSRTKIVWPSIPELQARLEAESREQVARTLGVSGSAVKKHMLVASR